MGVIYQNHLCQDLKRKCLSKLEIVTCGCQMGPHFIYSLLEISFFFIFSKGGLVVMHRDLKPENFLLSTEDENAMLKVTDFGLSVFIEEGINFIIVREQWRICLASVGR
ncbi:putative protein kinase CAMK-CDPK family [Helianthus anomalus]